MSEILELPKELYEIIKKEAYKMGKTVEEVILDSVYPSLDPEDREKIYLKLYENYLREVEKLYEREDLPQSGEKCWGAVTALLNIIAERRGWRHYSHTDYTEIIEKLSNETREPLGRLFASAERLHANFYHNFLTKINFEAHRDDALDLIEKLKKILNI
ncbi:MAG: PaREP1 family protein [Candidatus Bathyarchaeia archaeon]|nr:PaREP1 family protein [Candidatus Bathyarchaeota archaeon]